MRELIKTLLKENLIKESTIWYHGTPDARELENNGGFDERFISVTYIKNIKSFEHIQSLLKKYREIGDEDKYFETINKVGELKAQFKMNKPIFLSDKFSVAKTYADPNRSMDYQNAEEKVIKVNVNGGKTVRISAMGDRFRFININKVKRGFIQSGVNEDELNDVIKMFTFYTGNSDGIKTDVIAAIAKWLGFDSVDVEGVLDSYNGGTVKSTVKMVFDIKNLKIV